jgi:hypothetical protein
MNLRCHLKRIKALRVAHAGVQALRLQYGFGLRWLGGAGALVRFAHEYQSYQRLRPNPNFQVSAGNWIPCLSDRTETTPIEPIYFVQDTWFAGRIAQQKPEAHVDVGSSAKTMALIAQFIPVTMVDIRPIPIVVPGLTFVHGSVLEMPFADGSVPSLSSLCVVEHIGLGRYGDKVDPWGSEKTLHELLRVLAPGGDFYVSVPVDAENKIYFNAHRAFTRSYFLELCGGLELVDEQYLYGMEIVKRYEPTRGFGTGMYHFRKR